MFIRPRLFLTFLALCLVPLVLVGLVNYWSAVHNAEVALERDQKSELDNFQHEVNQLLTRDQNDLTNLSRSEPLREYLSSRSEGPVNSPALPALPLRSPAGGDSDAQGSASSPIPAELRVRVASVLNHQSHFASVSLFDRNSRALFVADLESIAANEPLAFHTKDFLSQQAQPDERLWTTQSTGLSSSVSTGPYGALVAYTVPIFVEKQDTGTPRGALLGELRLDQIFSDAGETKKTFSSPRADSLLVVLDRSGRFLYHSNEALKHQLVSERMPYFLPVAKQMFASEWGHHSFTSADGARYSVTYDRIPALNVSVAVASNRDQALAAAHRTGRIGLLVLVLLGLAAAWFLTLYFQRQAYGIERVAEGVEAIAKGALDHRIDLRSSDDLRPLADNVGLMTKQLREQIAREAETRQFQSFVRLSAVLTHDLKNAIEALSLIVSNMERHFDNEEFRADAMKSLNLATQNLRALVTRLSNPVNTLSGEHKRPQPVDLIPMLKRVISLTAEPARERHEIKIDLPESLFALVDPERIKKVVENLIINGLEAMTQKSGTLTVAAGQTDNGKVFFSVNDTGTGMSPRFIEERLFHPFATTKQRGVGLGLYTCREVVRANGGSIEVDSIQGAGTTFRVVLPSAAFARREDKEPPSQSHR